LHIQGGENHLTKDITPTHREASADAALQGRDKDIMLSRLNRRNILLGNTTVATAMALGAAAPAAVAQAQTAPAAPATGRPPNILVIWGMTSAPGTPATTTAA
jgi:hypothetical protein